MSKFEKKQTAPVVAEKKSWGKKVQVPTKTKVKRELYVREYERSVKFPEGDKMSYLWVFTEYKKPCLWLAYDTKVKGPFGKTIFISKDGESSNG